MHFLFDNITRLLTQSPPLSSNGSPGQDETLRSLKAEGAQVSKISVFSLFFCFNLTFNLYGLSPFMGTST